MPGVYQIVVTGTPQGSQSAFTLTYDTRVNVGHAVSSTGLYAQFKAHGFHFLLLIVLILTLVIIVAQEKLKKCRAVQEPSK
jgi:hypothetical protein